MSNSLTAVLVVIMLCVGTLGAGCSRDVSRSDDPKGRLNEYISKSFSISNVQQRDQLMEYLTGEAKVRLAAWSEDQFRQAFIDSKRQFVRFAFTEVKNVSSQEVNITYELTYIDQNKGLNAKVTNKKLCQMINEGGKWMIKDVRNIKELVEYQNELSLP